MKFIFVRHGESEGNAQNIRQGNRLDFPLTELGRQQAKQAAEILAKDEFAVIFTSSLVRAKQTAEIISKKLKVSMEIRPEIHEINLGDFSGKTWGEIANFFHIDEKTAKQTERNFRFDYRKWGGESGEELLNRVRKFVEYAKSKYRDGAVLVVTHAGFLRAMHHLYLKSESKPPVHNVSIHEFDL